MKLKLYIVAILITLFSAYAYATDMNYDTARKVYEAGKEVEAYQKSKMNGTYVDYSETPTWVSAIYGAIGIGIVGFFGLVFFLWLSDKMSGKNNGESNKLINRYTPPVDQSSNKKINSYTPPVDPNAERWSMMTVSQIMSETGQSERFVKTKLARECIKCSDYDGNKIGSEFRERMKQEGEVSKSEEELAIALLKKLEIESRVVENKYDKPTDSSEYKKLKETIKTGNLSEYIRKTTLDGLVKIQNILTAINNAAANKNIQLDDSKKITLLKKIISDETLENFRSVDIFFKKELFSDVYKNFLNSEIDTLSQLVNYALYDNAYRGEKPLRYDFEYFFRIGFLSNRKANSSSNGVYESYAEIGNLIDSTGKNTIDKIAARKYLIQSVIAAENSAQSLLAKIKGGNTIKSLDKIMTTQVTPVYFSCIYWKPDALEASKHLHEVIDESPNQYPGLRSLLKGINDEKNAEISGLKRNADIGKATIAELKKLHDLVSSPTEKFKYLAKACALSLKDKSGKTLVNSSNVKKLVEYASAIEATEKTILSEYLGENFKPSEFIELMEFKASLKKILNKSVKAGKISENQSFEIISSDENFSCPSCAETIGSNNMICPYCKHKLS